MVIEPPINLRTLPRGMEIVVAAIAHYKEIVQDIHNINPTLHCISLDEAYKSVRMKRIQASYIKNDFPEGKESIDLFDIVRSQEEYEAYRKHHMGHLQYENDLCYVYNHLPQKRGRYIGYCQVCGQERTFAVGYSHPENYAPVWVNVTRCPVCGLASRQRIVLEYLYRHAPEEKVFCYEAVTPLAGIVTGHFRNAIGSEYFGSKYRSGELVNGIMHQDALALSFADGSFDAMVSCDVLEHVADYNKALQESYRCLKDGGELIFSIPLFRHRYESVIRAELLDNGEIRHLHKPVYHGNPLGGGSLVFSEIGWQILDDLKKIGFRDAYAIVYSSVTKGHFGDLPYIFVAKK